MTIDLTLYRSIGNLTDWLVRFSIVMIILTVVGFAASSYQTLLVEYNPQFDKVYDITGIFILIVSILLNISLLFWYYRATKNIHSFGAKEVTSPRMAVVWWLIPIAFLWKPIELHNRYGSQAIPI